MGEIIITTTGAITIRDNKHKINIVKNNILNLVNNYTDCLKYNFNNNYQNIN
jgi:hypothetical protein